MSKTHRPYKASEGSLAWRVINWLRENPGEELTRADVSIKFDVPDNSVGGCLLQARQQGGLIVTTNSDGQRVYRLPDLITEAATA